MNDELIIKVLFGCMAVDGDMAIEEQVELKRICLMETNYSEQEMVEMITQLSDTLSSDSAMINSLLKGFSGYALSEDSQVALLESLIQMILADGVIQYEEIEYFARVCEVLSIPRELVAEVFPERVEWLDLARRDTENLLVPKLIIH